MLVVVLFYHVKGIAMYKTDSDGATVCNGGNCLKNSLWTTTAIFFCQVCKILPLNINCGRRRLREEDR